MEENGQVLRAAMHGGVGTNSMNTRYLRKMGLPLDLQQQFLNGLERLKSEHVDIFIGNHVGNNDTIGKAEQKKADPQTNPFIAPEEWQKFLDSCRKNMLDCMANPELQ